MAAFNRAVGSGLPGIVRQTTAGAAEHPGQFHFFGEGRSECGGYSKMPAQKIGKDTGMDKRKTIA